jgi:DNA-directed RNA polymerase subunit M/transcription elongation factor TFIIS
MHKCAFCGSSNTFLYPQMKIEKEVVWFKLGCGDCNREDRPALSLDVMKLVLMKLG